MTEARALTAIERIAAWSERLGYEQIPEAVRAVGLLCLLDTLGVAIAGSRRGVVEAVRAYAGSACAAGEATVLGSSWRLHPSGAALVNATAAHVLDFDDNCYAGSVHGSAVIVPAALAAAEASNLPGTDMLAALVAGAEAEYAVGDALTGSLYKKGWWTTGALGPLGAAVAAARAMRLDAHATAQALGLAVAGTGGVKACFGTDTKPVLCGRAAQAGMIAASLAARGVTGPADVFESPRGFARLFNAGVFDDRPFRELGQRWRLLDPGIDVKRIPLCLSSHAAVDGVLELLSEHQLGAPEVARVVCDVTPGVVANLAYARPQTVQEAQFSLNFAVACAVVLGDIRLQHLDAAVVTDPRVQDMMDRVGMLTSARWNEPHLLDRFPEGAFVTLVTRDGRTIEHFSGRGRGTAARPLTDAELEAKFANCATGVIGASQAEALLGRLRRVEALRSARELLQEIDWSGADRSESTGARR